MLRRVAVGAVDLIQLSEIGWPNIDADFKGRTLWKILRKDFGLRAYKLNSNEQDYNL